MKTTLLIATLVLASFGIGCESEGQKMADVHAEEETRAAQETLSLGAMAYNMGQCEQHLHISITHQTPTWTKFAKEHHIDSYPGAMSSADLKDCLAIKEAK